MSFLGEVTYTGKRNLRCFGNFLLTNMKGNKVMVEKKRTLELSSEPSYVTLDQSLNLSMS